MSYPDYTLLDTLDGTLSEELLHKEVKEDATITTEFLGITRSSDSFSLLFSTTPSASEQTRCDEIVAGHRDLPAVQDSLVLKIKTHRDSYRLKLSVFAEYPASSGNLFSCSASSQDNWAKLSILDSQGSVTYPYIVRTFDERSSYSILNSADREAITAVVALAVETERALADTYISAVLSATSSVDAATAAEPYFLL